MPLDSETRGVIDQLLQENPVVLFMKGTPAQPQCGFSAKTTSALEMLIPDYVTVNVLDHPAIRDGIKEYSNWPTIPQLYVNAELIGGSDIVLDMLSSGELADVLGVEKPTAETPSITISEDGIATIKKAMASQPDGSLHLQISASWIHQLNLASGEAGEVQVPVAEGLTIHLDPWSATRANGLNLILEEDLTGTRFIFDNPNAPPPVKPITVQSLKEKLDNNENIILIDVRRDEECAAGTIPGAKQWDEDCRIFVESQPHDSEIIIHCHAGGRSQALAEALRQRGFTNLSNVTGGIKAWAEEIDPSLNIS